VFRSTTVEQAYIFDRFCVTNKTHECATLCGFTYPFETSELLMRDLAKLRGALATVYSNSRVSEKGYLIAIVESIKIG